MLALVGLTATVGKAFTVTVSVTVHPLLSVYVITLVPDETPVRTPALVIVATEVVADTQAFVVAAVPLPVNVISDPSQTLVALEVIVGLAFTVTVKVLLYAVLLPSLTLRRYCVVCVKPLGTS